MHIKEKESQAAGNWLPATQPDCLPGLAVVVCQIILASPQPPLKVNEVNPKKKKKDRWKLMLDEFWFSVFMMSCLTIGRKGSCPGNLRWGRKSHWRGVIQSRIYIPIVRKSRVNSYQMGTAEPLSQSMQLKKNQNQNKNKKPMPLMTTEERNKGYCWPDLGRNLLRLSCTGLILEWLRYCELLFT